MSREPAQLRDAADVPGIHDSEAMCAHPTKTAATRATMASATSGLLHAFSSATSNGTSSAPPDSRWGQGGRDRSAPRSTCLRRCPRSSGRARPAAIAAAATTARSVRRRNDRPGRHPDSIDAQIGRRPDDDCEHREPAQCDSGEVEVLRRGADEVSNRCWDVHAAKPRHCSKHDHHPGHRNRDAPLPKVDQLIEDPEWVEQIEVPVPRRVQRCPSECRRTNAMTPSRTAATNSPTSSCRRRVNVRMRSLRREESDASTSGISQYWTPRMRSVSPQG